MAGVHEEVEIELGEVVPKHISRLHLEMQLEEKNIKPIKIIINIQKVPKEEVIEENEAAIEVEEEHIRGKEEAINIEITIKERDNTKEKNTHKMKDTRSKTLERGLCKTCPRVGLK